MTANGVLAAKFVRAAAVATLGMSLLAMSSCSDSPGSSSSPGGSGLAGKLILVGRAPHAHESYIVGAVSGGRVVHTAAVQRDGKYRISLPPGRYVLGVWSPGMVESARNITCAIHVRVAQGTRRDANIRCTFH